MILKEWFLFLCVAAVPFTMSSCHGEENVAGDNEESVSELLLKLSKDNPNLDYHRLVQLEKKKGNILKELGFLPHFVRLFEFFERGSNPPEVEVKISILTLANPQKSDKWEISIQEESIPVTKALVVSSEDEKRVAKAALFFADLVFLLPIPRLEELDGSKLVLSTNEGSCEISLQSTIYSFKKARKLALESSEPVVELHAPIRAEQIIIPVPSK